MRVSKKILVSVALLAAPTQGWGLDLRHTFQPRERSFTNELKDSGFLIGEFVGIYGARRFAQDQITRSVQAQADNQIEQRARALGEEAQPGTTKALDEMAHRENLIERNLDEARRTSPPPFNPYEALKTPDNQVLEGEIKLRQKAYGEGIGTYALAKDDMLGKRQFNYLPADFDEQVDAKVRRHRLASRAGYVGMAILVGRFGTRLFIQGQGMNAGNFPIASLALHGIKSLDEKVVGFITKDSAQEAN